MADPDLDVIIRQIAKAQSKTFAAAIKKRRDQIMARAAKAKDKDAKDQLKHLAKSAMLHGVAAAKRLQNSAENTADSYARAIKYAAADWKPAKKPSKKPAKKDA